MMDHAPCCSIRLFMFSVCVGSALCGIPQEVGGPMANGTRFVFCMLLYFLIGT